MWRLLRTELNYDKFKILIVYVICIICFITVWFGVKWERNRAPMTMLIMLVSTIMVGYYGEAKRIAQKRDGYHVLLPVSVLRIGAVRLIYPILIWVSILLLFFILVFIILAFYPHGLTRPSAAQFLTLNGLIMIVNVVYLLYSDLRMTFTQKHQRFVIFLFWFLIYISALLPFYIMTNFFGLFGENTILQIFINKLFRSPVRFNFFGLVFSILSLIVFVNRRSYVDS